MFDLVSASKSDTRWYHSAAILELCRVQEVLADYFYGDNQYGSTPENLLKYFDDFARVVRK